MQKWGVILFEYNFFLFSFFTVGLEKKSKNSFFVNFFPRQNCGGFFFVSLGFLFIICKPLYPYQIQILTARNFFRNKLCNKFRLLVHTTWKNPSVWCIDYTWNILCARLFRLLASVPQWTPEKREEFSDNNIVMVSGKSGLL